jgi:hypothetical protein
MRKPTVLLVSLAAASAAIALPVAVATTTAAPRAAAVIQAAPNPADFSAPKANPYFPLRPGTVTTYRGNDEGLRLRERLYVTHRTRMIQGVRTRVIRDVLRRANGVVAEATTDWYAADNDGNVWYFGESTATYDEKGHLESREGSWLSGHNGAQLGMIMPAHPHATQAFRQEFLRDHAEDQAWIVSRFGRTTTPLKTFTRVVRSFEWTRLEPGVLSLKMYAPGVGIVRERDMSGGSESFAVVSVRHN